MYMNTSAHRGARSLGAGTGTRAQEEQDVLLTTELTLQPTMLPLSAITLLGCLFQPIFCARRFHSLSWWILRQTPTE